jgi:cellulose synthase/poly-beta-1,6-N-acetylglucosamine synthase-like glycosyltransferase
VRLTAIVPATNEPQTLEACLEAIRAAEESPDEVIVIRAPPFAGPAAARNDGAQSASGDVLVFVDADVLVHRDAFRRIRSAFAEDETLAALFGSYDDEPKANGVVSSFRNLLHHHVHQASGGPATTFWGGLGAMRADVFREAGGFDAGRYPQPSIEDIELGMRIARSGARIILEPTVQGKHLKSWSLAQMVETDLLRRGVPWLRLLFETGESSQTLNLGVRHRLSTVSALVIAAGLVTRRPRTVAAGALTLVVLNRSFYALLLRKRGAPEAIAGIGLHALHHLTAAAAVPPAILQHVASRKRAARGSPQEDTNILQS